MIKVFFTETEEDRIQACIERIEGRSPTENEVQARLDFKRTQYLQLAADQLPKAASAQTKRATVPASCASTTAPAAPDSEGVPCTVISVPSQSTRYPRAPSAPTIVRTSSPGSSGPSSRRERPFASADRTSSRLAMLFEAGTLTRLSASGRRTGVIGRRSSIGVRGL